MRDARYFGAILLPVHGGQSKRIFEGTISGRFKKLAAMVFQNIFAGPVREMVPSVKGIISASNNFPLPSTIPFVLAFIRCFSTSSPLQYREKISKIERVFIPTPKEAIFSCNSHGISDLAEINDKISFFVFQLMTACAE